MKKEIIYTTKDNQDFSIKLEDNIYHNNKVLLFSIFNGASNMYFLDVNEVDEFCELLQEYKKLM